jgi:hypothetical protein
MPSVKPPVPSFSLPPGGSGGGSSVIFEKESSRMEKFKLTVKLDPDDEQDRHSVAQLLMLVAHDGLQNSTARDGVIRDQNGKKVGKWRIMEARQQAARQGEPSHE